MCGGTRKGAAVGTRRTGLSPRVRGNPLHFPGVVSRSRSIPACAGEPGPVKLLRGAIRVYPRVCGGTLVKSLLATIFDGLSPRVRGNLHQPHRRQVGGRSIPACAGEPRVTATRCTFPTVYPRVCGGTLARPSLLTMSAGLSPRVRGNRQYFSVPPDGSGSIPACAGEPPWPPQR